MRPVHPLRDGALELGVLSAFIVLVYGAVLGLLRAAGAGDGLLPSIAATTLVAASFQPARARVRRGINRMLYGQRLPYEVLRRFSERVANTYATDEVLARIAAVVREGVRCTHADVWLRVGGTLRLSASNPPETRITDEVPIADPPRLPGAEIVIPVRQHGELLGALAISAPDGMPIAPTERRLLDDLASQAGPVLQNVRLAAELQARADEIARHASAVRESRQRIVETHDDERRRLERDIHDGAQQHLVALAVKLRLAQTLSERQPERAGELVGELRSAGAAALEALRDTTREVYPATLTDEGLGRALAAQAVVMETGRRRVQIDSEGIGRYPLEAETAVYFICLEALQNAAKHSEASSVTVRLYESPGHLCFAISDDGAGFDPAEIKGGSGLRNIHDRAAALGGSVRVVAEPGRGTTIHGRIPAGRP